MVTGTWTGTDTLSGGGKCKLAGGVDSVTNPVRMVWTVHEDGDVTILLPDWPGVYPYSFYGKVNPDLSVELVLTTSALCNTTQHSFSVGFESQIQQDGDGYRLELVGDETWCPLLCTFQRRYEVGKE